MPAELPDIGWIRRHVLDEPHYTPAGSPVGVNARDIRNAHMISHLANAAVRATYGSPAPTHRHDDPMHPMPDGWVGPPHPLWPRRLNREAWQIACTVEQQVRAIVTGEMTDAELEADPTPTDVWCHTAFSLAYTAATYDHGLTAQAVFEVVEEQLGHLTIVDREAAALPAPGPYLTQWQAETLVWATTKMSRPLTEAEFQQVMTLEPVTTARGNFTPMGEIADMVFSWKTREEHANA